MVVALLAARAGAKLKRSVRTRALVAEVRDGDARVVLARPASYVNESGGPASLLARWYKTPVERIVVVHDEIDLAYGKLQVRQDGGTAGHNGLKDVAKALGSPDFLRVRIGVGRPPGPNAPRRRQWPWPPCRGPGPRTATTTSAYPVLGSRHPGGCRKEPRVNPAAVRSAATRIAGPVHRT